VELLLASGSRYRAEVLRGAGYTVRTSAPEVDERALDHWLVERGPEALAVELAQLKLRDVLTRRSTGLPVVAADQVGILWGADGPLLLTKADDHESACSQLRRLSGTTHQLINGLIVWRNGESATGVDVMEVTFRDLSEEEIRTYVERFEPFDTAGSYRIEDDGGHVPFVTEVIGEDRSGVLGLPLPLLRRLLVEVGAGDIGGQ